MRDSEVGGSLKHTHFIRHEDSKGQNHKGNTSFVVREVPIQRMKRGAQCATNSNASSEYAELSKGKRFSDMENVMMDYDTPELVVFLQEVLQEDRGVSTKGNCVIQDCELESNSESYEDTTETMSSISNGSDSVNDATNKSGFRNLMMMVEGDHPTENRTSETLQEVIDEKEDFLRLFNNNHGESSSCAGPAATKSGSVSHQSSDSISSAHSFTFPVLQTEWTGSPVRMAEADYRTSQSRRHRWRKIFCFCCKF